MAKKQVFVRAHYRKAARSASCRRNVGVGLEGYLLVAILLVVGCYFLYRWWLTIPSSVYMIVGLVVLFLIALVMIIEMVQLRRRWRDHQLHAEEIVQLTPTAPAPTPAPTLDPARVAILKTRGDVLSLTAREFEELVADLMRISGYSQVTRVGGAGDLCADITAIDKDGNNVVVQCKRYSPGQKVGSPDLQKFLGMVTVRHKAQRGIFVTTSAFSQPALRLAADCPETLLLVDGERLIQWIHTTTSLS